MVIFLTLEHIQRSIFNFDTTYEYTIKISHQEPQSFSHSLLAKHTASLSWVTSRLKEHEVLWDNTEKQSNEMYEWRL